MKLRLAYLCMPAFGAAAAIAMLAGGGTPAPASASAALQGSAPACPVVRVSCPDQAAQGDAAAFTANVEGGDPSVTPTYNWTVSTGTIASGQGTSTISLDTAGLGGQSMTATVDVGGYARDCASAHSCTMSVTVPAAPAVKFDEFSLVREKDMKRRLDNWVSALQNDPTAQGYLISYGGRRSKPGDAQANADKATDYTINKRKMDGSRTLSGVGGYREEPTIELFIAPAGGAPPMATPTVNDSEVAPKL